MDAEQIGAGFNMTQHKPYNSEAYKAWGHNYSSEVNLCASLKAETIKYSEMLPLWSHGQF